MICLEHIEVHQGHFRLSRLDLRVEQGQYAVLMGPTGCGKTTILELVCGLRRPSAGTITIANTTVCRSGSHHKPLWLRPAERGVGYVPQEGALFARMRIARQIGFALEIRKWPRPQRLRRIHELADRLGITHLLDRTPAGLSGGERQRVALGRALAARPDVVCLDEPLSALDEHTRADMCRLLEDTCHDAGVTALHVTHSSDEARRLADRLFRLDHGRITELDPLDLQPPSLGPARADTSLARTHAEPPHRYPAHATGPESPGAAAP